jgi:asparagine synthase (glutamine-hydrolysing)
MCGISVIISKGKCSIDKAQLISMNNQIIHRGPDDEGYFYGNDFGFGFRRLSILDVSALGHQPMEFENKYIIIHNGEIFNYVELKVQLSKHGYSFKSTSDTEVILASYDFWGEECVKYFNGMWAFVIYDKKRNILFGSRDRYGIKPFNYTNLNNYFLIGSEIKQFTVFEDFKPRLNIHKALLFLAKSALCTDNETFFRDVYVLPPGSNMIYNLYDNTYTINKYYDQSLVKTNKDIDFETASKEFLRLFTNAVSIRLRSDVKIGSCLSGGLDSSSIITVAKGITSSNFTANTISSCFTDPRFDEQEYIDVVTRHTGYNAIKIFPDLNDMLNKDLLELINYHQDQPIPGASHFSEYSVFEAAKMNDLTVMLDGQGSDEFLAGYLSFQIFNYSLLKDLKIFTLFRELYFQKKYHYKLHQILRYNFNYLKGRFITNNNKHDHFDWIDKQVLNLSGIHLINNKLFNSYQELSLNQIQVSSIPYQLHSEDRNSMMHSVESRLPFLDFDLTDFMFSLPDNFKIRNGKTKAILRDSLKEFLPQEIRNRHSKMGFVAPEEKFIRKNSVQIRGNLKNAIDASDNMLKPILISEFDKMIAGTKEYDQIYFRTVSLYLWQKAFGVKVTL